MKNVLLPGVAAGLVLGLVFIAIHTLGAALSYGAQEIIGIAAIVVALFAAQAFTVARQPRALADSFLPRYFTTVLCGVAAAIVYSIMTALHFTLVDPNYLTRFYARYLERVRAEATTPQHSEQLLDAAEKMKDFVMDPFSQALVQFGTALMLGLLAGVIVAVLVKPAARDA